MEEQLEPLLLHSGWNVLLEGTYFLIKKSCFNFQFIFPHNFRHYSIPEYYLFIYMQRNSRIPDWKLHGNSSCFCKLNFTKIKNRLFWYFCSIICCFWCCFYICIRNCIDKSRIILANILENNVWILNFNNVNSDF
mgnify:CR=1 FL=1